MMPPGSSLAPQLKVPTELIPSLPENGSGNNGAPADHRAYLAARLLWDHRQFVATVMARGTVLALLLAFLIPARYESTTALMPPDSSSAGAAGLLMALNTGGTTGGTTGNGLMSMASDLLGLKTSGALFISILKSDTVQDRLIDRFDLRRVYWVSTYASARKKLAQSTDFEEERKSGVISITVTDHDPQRAMAMGRAYVEELDRLVAELNTSAAHRERVFLEERLKVVKQDLSQAEKDFSEFASKNTAIDIKEQGRAMVEAAATLQGEMIAAQSQLSGLEQIYTPNNIRVRSTQARIGELQRQLQKLGGSATPVAADAEGNEPLYPSIRQLPVLGVPYADFYRRVKVNEAIFEVLTKQYELARVQEAKEVPSVKVIDRAEAPEKRSGPPRTLITLGGALLSFCLAGAWLFSREAWRNSDPEDPRKLFLVEVATAASQKSRWKTAGAVSLKAVSGRMWRVFSRNHHNSE